MHKNFLLQTDSYKLNHAPLYPEDTTGMYAYFESRGGVFPTTVFFGLQGIIKEHLEGVLFDTYDIDEAEVFARAHFGRPDCFPREKWLDLLKVHGGVLPICIKALPEGTEIPTHNVLFTVENTDPRFPWLVPYIETILMKVWYPITIATQSKWIKDALRTIRQKASDNLDGLDFMVHDFGYRGCTSEEQAAIGGAAHLLSFKGTDTIAGIRYLQQYYTTFTDEMDEPPMYGFSVPATEHSVVLAFGKDGEEEAFKKFLDTYPEGIVACVSDTYDIYNAVNNLWGDKLKERVLSRNGTLVIRPDSGDPCEVVATVLMLATDRFGFTLNNKGYKVLPSQVRIIQGDGMNRETILQLHEHIVALGYAPENLTVGAGGGTLQGVNRDTQRFAYKVSDVERKGVHIPVRKTPVTDTGKTSKAGQFSVWRNSFGHWYTLEGVDVAFDELKTVFDDGYLLRDETYDEIVERMEHASTQ